jgi:AraC family transcriptional regulator
MTAQQEPRYTGATGGRWYFWDGGFLAIGRPRGQVPTHSHHAIQIAISLEAPIRLKHGEDEWRSYEAAAVLPDEPHAFNADGILVALLLIDPETREGRWLRASATEPISALAPARLSALRDVLRHFWEEPPDAEGTTEVVDQVVRQFCKGIPPLQMLEERVARAIDEIQQLDARVVSLDEIAGKVFLSPSRFAHLFSTEVGIPFRRYLLWRRLTRAMVLVTRGDSLSRAAHSAGFSDAAHFTRTFYQMFGIPPSAMLGQGSMYEIPAPFQLARATGP